MSVTPTIYRPRGAPCVECGRPTVKYGAQRCGRCHNARGTVRQTCPDCGGPKGYRAIRCHACHMLRRQTTLDDWRHVVMAFDAEAFRAELDRSELDWSLPQLADASGISVQTLRKWLSGSVKPYRSDLEAVTRTLAFERCGACHGAGHLDPTKPGIQRVLVRVVKQRPLTIVQSAVTGAGWALDRNTLALSIGGAAVQATQQESRLIAMLAAADGRFVTSAQLGEALGIGTHAIHTYLTRLRDKCVAAGMDLGSVVQNGRGAGYRAVMTERAEAVS